MSTRMQQRRGTAEQWTLANPVLATGEIGVETDTYKFKIGDGVNTWSSLEYFSANAEVDLSGYYTSSETDTAISTAVANVVDAAPGVLDTLNELAAAIGDDANFVTTINTTITDGDAATLASAQSYADTQDAALSATITAAYEAYADGATTDMATNTYVDAQDATTLAAANSYTDTEIAALVDSSPATLDTLNELAAALGDDANFATTVSNQIAGKADASHTHAISDVTNLQTELDGKLSSSADYTEEATYGPFGFGGFYEEPTETTTGRLNPYGGFVPSGSISIGDEFRIITSLYRSNEIDNVVFIYQGTTGTLNFHTALLKDNADQQAVADYNSLAQAGDSVDYIVINSNTANITEQNLASLRNVTSDIQGQIDSMGRVLLEEITVLGSNRFRFTSISQDYDELIFEGVDLSLEAWDNFYLRINSINAEVNLPTALTDIFDGNTSSTTSNVFELRIPNYSLSDRPKMGPYFYAGYSPMAGYNSGQGVIFENTFNAITQVELQTSDEDFSKGTIRMYGIKY